MGTLRILLLAGLLGGCATRTPPPNIRDADVDLRMPRAEAFVFGPGDALRIFVWRHDDLTMDVTIAPDGAITYPLVGRLQIAGMTYEQVVKTLEAAIGEYYQDAQVAVNILTVSSQKVLVLGEVTAPQVLQLTQEMSILEAMVKAGGINTNARTRNVLLIRGGLEKPELYAVDVEAIYGRGDFSQMVYLQAGDIVVVPPTTITNVERFFKRISGILGPAVSGSAIYRNVVSGNAQIPPQ